MNPGRAPATLGILPARLAALALWFAPPAQACPAEVLAARVGVEVAHATEADAVHAAHSSALLGGGSAFSTAQAARRVMSEGRDWQFTGQIVLNAEVADDRVATPYRTQANSGPMLVATELLEELVLSGYAGATLSLSGRMAKDPDGGQLVVLTSWRVINS